MGVLEIESRHHFLRKGMKLARAMPAKVSSCASGLSSVLLGKGMAVWRLRQTGPPGCGPGWETGASSVLGSELSAILRRGLFPGAASTDDV